MLSKNPLEFPKDKKFTKEELAQALRYSIIAELDAINLYLQFATATADERFRKVFEDIAKEEKTHVGEFLSLLKTLDPEQVAELKAGREEVKELTGIEAPDPPGNSNSNPGNPVVSEVPPPPEPLTETEWSKLVDKFKSVLDATRKIRQYLPVTSVGRGVQAVLKALVTGGETYTTKGFSLLPLSELSVKFELSQRSIDYARRVGEELDVSPALAAASMLARMEDQLLLEGDKKLGTEGLLTAEGTLSSKVSDWEDPQATVIEVSKAVSELLKEGATEPFILFVSYGRYSRLLKVYERGRMTALERIKQIVKDVVPIYGLPDDKALLVSAVPYVIDVVVGADSVVDYIGPEDGKHVFRAWSTVTLRIKFPKGIMVLSE